MATNTTSSMAPDLPNPQWPLAFFSEKVAWQISVSTYVHVGTAAVIIWDVLGNLYPDYVILLKRDVAGPTLSYFVSRITTLGYVLASVIFRTSPAGACYEIGKAVNWIYPVAVASTSLLFFHRVRAIYNDKYFTIFFALLWLGVVGGCLTVTQGIKSKNIGPTNWCVIEEIEEYVPAAGLLPLINDTLIFFAITWRLFWTSTDLEGVTYGYRFKDVITGRSLPAFSRALLRDGQAYYLVMVISNVATIVLLYGDVPLAYQTMLVVPNAAIMNIMACRVFRKVKLQWSSDSDPFQVLDPSKAKATSAATTPSPPRTPAVRRVLHGLARNHSVAESQTTSSSARVLMSHLPEFEFGHRALYVDDPRLQSVTPSTAESSTIITVDRYHHGIV